MIVSLFFLLPAELPCTVTCVHISPAAPGLSAGLAVGPPRPAALPDTEAAPGPALLAKFISTRGLSGLSGQNCSRVSHFVIGQGGSS